jgi:hypothetical protein
MTEIAEELKVTTLTEEEVEDFRAAFVTASQQAFVR